MSTGFADVERGKQATVKKTTRVSFCSTEEEQKEHIVMHSKPFASCNKNPFFCRIYVSYGSFNEN